MTPECPKGPGRGARPEEAAAMLLLESSMEFQSLRDLESPDERVNDGYFEAQARHQIRRLVESGWRAPNEQSEVERLTAEVERLHVELGTIRGELADFAQESVPSHVSTLQAVRWLIAEHDEQVKHNEEIGEENRALCNERDEWKRAAEDVSPQLPAFKVGDEVRWCWTGANADGAWFKARLTEEHPANYPKGWAGEITDCGTAYTAEHMGEVSLGFHVYMDVPSMTLVSELSPSLRKEGGDSD